MNLRAPIGAELFYRFHEKHLKFAICNLLFVVGRNLIQRVFFNDKLRIKDGKLQMFLLKL